MTGMETAALAGGLSRVLENALLAGKMIEHVNIKIAGKSRPGEGISHPFRYNL
jgi:hypothetical protein